ncbi:D-ribose pyranase [Volucribacter amazonae]|uniref:D-ribose pyranase n=1 Tax=Volucribacter amazonae TaxID=256731 RepID=A0A9X4SQL3_9PAST|nr:D-ribose pyranase [Volucribacter amazonae]MDG6895481.1 D-ribose pyranase [Volucribacter amazonae]
MKKTALLNAPLSHLIARLGHTDSLAICDAGLPIAQHLERIDLALCPNIPSFLQTFDVVVQELFVERVLLASEIKQKNPQIYTALLAKIADLAEQQGNTIQIDEVEHAVFKQQTQSCKGIVRTGECSPYANIILYSGVPF